MFKLAQERHGDVLVVEVSGRVEAAIAPGFERDVVAQINDGAIRLVLDCSKMTYIASAGLRVLLVVARRLADDKGSFAVAAVPKAIREILAISGFDQVINVTETVDEAVASA